DHGGAVGVLLQLGVVPGLLGGRQAARVASVAGLVVGVQADDAQAVEVVGEVGLAGGRLRREHVPGAVVPLAFAGAAGRVALAGMRPVVVAPGHQVVAAERAELVEDAFGARQVDGGRFAGDVAGRE